MRQAIERIARAVAEAERLLIITGAGLSADSGLPTYRGLGGLYNGHTAEGLPIEAALSGPMLQRDPALCWKYLAELGKACLGAQPNAAHRAIAELQGLKPGCWVLTQNIDGYHRAAGSPAQRLIEIHGQLAPLYCLSCAAEDAQLLEHLQRPLPPLCARCGGVLRPPVTLFEERLPEAAIDALYAQLEQGFDLVLSVGTSASFPYIVEPVLRTRRRGGLTVEVNPSHTDLSDVVDIRLPGRALDVFPELLSHIQRHRICKSPR
ncbi:NAD-dependent deacylase [Phytopseudomonas dryadis]|uniref:protein acetyllysine N-acetyltransferase n=1 Tax=Phytopseudomonas dryadis TaxID=2487520 RepID=A0ABY1ZBK6_9GAMM|nr:MULTISPECIES: NAD-dependent deacylase [Pseudomonas]TBV07052.1 NAD-dependent protein deacylase [Pseudomonas dryadis]TBV19554.1 NAD-dependent protein deacylase [Pseudomonas sp. FRB 230]